MHAFMHSIGSVFWGLASAAGWLSTRFSKLTCALPSFGLYALGAAVVSSLALAVGCSCWAVAERTRSVQIRQHAGAALRRSQIAVHFRDALISSLPEGIVVLRTLGGASLSYQGASRLLQTCLDGPEGSKLAVAINALMDRCVPFALDVRTVGICDVAIRGRLMGDSAVIFLQHADRKKNTRQESRERLRSSGTRAIAA